MKTIAIDIDDVLADQAGAFLEYSNATWGTHFTLDDYTEHWRELWKVDMQEVERRAVAYHASGVIGQFKYKSEALPVLKKLKESYNLEIVTSRRAQVKDETIEWIERNFEGIFSGIHFAGFFDNLDEGRWHYTKAGIVKSLGADYLIDDQLKHCIATSEAGIETVLFGEYTWNQIDEMPERMSRCGTWQEVGEYFEARR